MGGARYIPIGVAGLGAAVLWAAAFLLPGLSAPALGALVMAAVVPVALPGWVAGAMDRGHRLSVLRAGGWVHGLLSGTVLRLMLSVIGAMGAVMWLILRLSSGEARDWGPPVLGAVLCLALYPLVWRVASRHYAAPFAAAAARRGASWAALFLVTVLAALAAIALPPAPPRSPLRRRRQARWWVRGWPCCTAGG